MSGEPTEPAAPPHLGELIMTLREAAGMSRAALEAQTGVQASALRALEYGRHRVSAAILRRLLVSPALASLPARAAAAGIPLPKEDDGVEGHKP